MTNAPAVPASGLQIQTLDTLTADQEQAVRALLAEAARTDGQQAVSEQGRLQLRGGRREGVQHFLVTVDGTLTGYAQLEATDPVEAPAAELVVHPSHRGQGNGRALGSALMAASGRRLRVWAHGGTPPPAIWRRSSGWPSSVNFGSCGGRWCRWTFPSRCTRTG